jgi:diadenosine hexaphosphate hydrolase (ATP-forming)
MVLNDDEENHWEFPKGKKEEGETDQETALRELYEETGLQGNILSDETINFSFDCTVKGMEYHKTVRYFFCEVFTDTVQLQKKELGDYIWLRPDELEAQATFASMKEVARKVCTYLKND